MTWLCYIIRGWYTNCPLNWEFNLEYDEVARTAGQPLVAPLPGWPLPIGHKTAPVRMCVETHGSGDSCIFSLIAPHPQGAALIIVQVAFPHYIHIPSVKGKMGRQGQSPSF